MNEKKNDRQQGGARRDGGMKRNPGQDQGRKEETPDRTRTGQVGGEGRDEDKDRQGKPGLNKDQLPQKQGGRNVEEEIE